nr:glucose-methanol-choline oxidoreductase, FAD/NAD(P)-binding domain protein [Tanacetum cinerariifolium]
MFGALECDPMPSIVLDDECLISKDLSKALLGRVKEFASLPNLKIVLKNEGFAEIKIQYMGEFWVLLDFPSSKTKELFQENMGVGSWFSVLKQASFIPEGRIVWVEIEGVPFKLWSKNTFKRFAAKWGKLLDVDDQEEEGFHSKRLCIYSKSGTNIYENFKVIFRGKVFLIRVKEVPGWVPEFVDDSDDDDDDESDNGFKDGDAKVQDGGSCGDDSDEVEVSEIVFEESLEQKENQSKDPFGFIPNSDNNEFCIQEENVRSVNKANSLNSNMEENQNGQERNSTNKGSKEEISGSACLAMDVAQKAKIKWAIEGDENTSQAKVDVVGLVLLKEELMLLIQVNTANVILMLSRQIILNGDSHVPTRVVEGVLQPVAPTTAEQSLKIYETEVKHSSSASTALQNLDFVSSSHTDSINDSVSAAASVSIACAKLPASPLPNVDSLSNAVIYSFFASQSTSPQLDKEDLKQIDVDDLEDMDLRWQMVMLTMRARRFLQKTGRNLGTNGPTSMGFDMSKVECYNCYMKGHFVRECSYQAEEEPANFALMAFSSSSSSSNNEVPSCSKACSKVYAQLHTQYDKLTGDFCKSQFDVISYQTDLEYVEARLLVYKQNESVFKENIKLLNIEVQLRDTALVTLRQKLKKAKKDRDDLKLKSDCESWPPSSLYDRFQPGGGYHVVPHTYTGTFMPLKPDLVFNIAPTAVETDHLAFNAPQFVPSFAQSFEHVKSPRHTVQETKTTIPAATPAPESPKSNSSGKRRNRKACFACKSVDHLIKDCDFHTKKMAQPTQRNYAHRVLPQSKQVSNTAVRPVSAALPNFTMTRPRHAHHVVIEFKSPIRRYITRSPSSKTSNLPPRVTAVQALVVSAAQGRQGTWGNPQQALKDKGVIGSGCSRYMTGNRSYLYDFEELNGGYVAFGGNPKGGKITGNDKIKAGKLDFDDVYFVKELKFNLFSLPDESQVLVRVPRENNMYNVNLKNIDPSGDLTCLFAKAIIDESNLWHRRLGHINFKTINKLAEAVNTACYVQNRTLVTKPHNKTPYELLHGRTPSIGFMRPFGCLVTILNTLDPLGKFQGKVDEGFLVGYSVCSKAFRVFNSRTRIIQETMHVNFLENKPNVAEKAGDEVDQTYVLFSVWSAGSTNPQNNDEDAAFDGKEHDFDAKKPESVIILSSSSSAQSRKQDDKTKKEDKGKSPVESFTGYRDFVSLEKSNKNVIGLRILIFNMQTQTSNTLHNAIMEAGSKDRPPMLAPGIDNDIYSTVDACLNACDIWKEIERLKHGESINVQDLETNLYWEFRKFTSQDGESLESYYSRMESFVTLVKQSQELKIVSYHKLYDILKQHQHEVNEIRAEKIARVTNPLALVAQQQSVYHPQNHPTHYTQNSSRNRGKAIVNSPQLIYDQEPSMVAEDDEMSKDKEIDKLMALISLSFKKIYKPTNNNLRTSSNTSRANQDNSPRINRSAGYENQRIGNVVGARENIDAADSGPIFDDEPLQKVSNDDHYNVFAMESIHPEQSKSAHDTYLIEQDAQNVIIDSLDMNYVDSDYAGASLDRKSTTGGCQFLGCRLISWQCKKQTVVATSSIETKYVAAASCCAQVLWIQNQLLDYG